MNETEKDRILRMVSEGTLRPNEAAQLLAALTDDAPKKPEEKTAAAEKEKPKTPTMEIQMQRADGTYYTVQVPTNLVPMFLKIAGVTIRESARVAALEAWSGFKHIVRDKAQEVRTNAKATFSGTNKTAEAAPPVTPEQEQQSAARAQILQMVQNGRISAEDASRLIQQLDALNAYQSAHPQPAASTTTAR